MNTNTNADESDGRGILSTKAYLAVGLLTDEIEADTYGGRDVDEAAQHLRDGLDAAPHAAGADRVGNALARLDAVDELTPAGRERAILDAQEQLAPVAAGLSGQGDAVEADETTVPVFYHVPPKVADRAIDRFQHRQAADDIGVDVLLKEAVWTEIDEKTVIYVGGQTLEEYAADQGVDVDDE